MNKTSLIKFFILSISCVSIIGCTFSFNGKITNDEDQISNSISLNLSSPTVNLANNSSYNLSGTCSSEGSQIEILFDNLVMGSSTCSAGQWLKTLDLSSTPDASYAVAARMTIDGQGSQVSPLTNLIIDTTNPSLTGSLTDGTYFNSLSQSPILNWSAATDSLSGIDHYEIAIGTSLGGTQALTWTSVGNVTNFQVSGLSLTEATYYPSIRAVDVAGNISSVLQGDGWVVDATPPSAPTSLSDKFGETLLDKSPVADWTGSTDSLSGLSHYELAVGSSPGSTDISNWQNVGITTSAQATGLSLIAGNMYYLSVRAVDNAGNTSASANGDGWRIFSIDFSGTYCTGGPSYYEKPPITDGTLSFLFGKFTQVGKCVSGGAPLSTTSESFAIPYINIPQVTGTILTVISDQIDTNADGISGWYIGGTFTKVGSYSRNNIAHIKEDGTVDAGFDPNANAAVNALALISSDFLYVGGDFTNIGGLARNRLAKVKTLTGEASTWDPNANSTILTMTFDSITGNLYVGGYFTAFGATTRNRLASFDSAGSLTTWNPNANGSVNALAKNGSTLYVGGAFSTLNGGTTRNKLASFDLSTGNLSSWDPNGNGTVNSIAIGASSLYVSGLFTTFGGTFARGNIASFELATGNLTSWSPSKNSTTNGVGTYINALAITGSTLFVGGYFDTMESQPRNSLASFDTTTGNITSWNPNVGGTSVNALAATSNAVYVGGNLTTILGKPRMNLAAFDSRGNLTSWNPKSDNGVLAATVNENTIYAGGSFSNIGGSQRSFIGAVGTDNNATSWNPNANSTVYALATKGNTVYAGGIFQSINGAFRNRLAAIDATTGLATAWDPNPFQVSFPAVYFLYINGGTIYVGGDFTSIGGQSRNKFASVDETTGLATNFNPNPDNYVNAVAVNSTNIYLGGSFTNISGQARNRIAAFDAGTGAVTGWNPNSNGNITSLALGGTTTVYAGGTFTNIGGQNRNFVANLDATTGLATSWDPNPLANPTSMILLGLKAFLYQTGVLTAIGN